MRMLMRELEGRFSNAMAVMCVDEWINKMGVRWMVAV